ncbi:acyl-CoA dehydrogenase family protein [Streptomyces coryli]|uniref:acyl-CoA dehydrogenase family protein n=1 Tax=Streptomyces coryli TaxID=1128680 RepID=UPI0019CFF6EB|nr:acyl-CoA dehydrogenase family protein [Streptomyces coryli]
MTNGYVLDPELGRRCRARARDDGPAPALQALTAELGPGYGPGGHTMLPLHPAPDTRSGARQLATVEHDSGAVGVWQDEGRRDGAAAWALGAAWVRLGLAERLLQLATAYIGGRRTGGEPLIQVSAVRTMIGEAAGDLAEAALLLDLDGADGLPRAAVATAQAQRTGLRLLGASGYVDGEPGRLARINDLLGDIYPAETADMAEMADIADIAATAETAVTADSAEVSS